MPLLVFTVCHGKRERTKAQLPGPGGRGESGVVGGVELGRFILSVLVSHDKLCQKRHLSSV